MTQGAPEGVACRWGTRPDAAATTDAIGLATVSVGPPVSARTVELPVSAPTAALPVREGPLEAATTCSSAANSGPPTHASADTPAKATRSETVGSTVSGPARRAVAPCTGYGSRLCHVPGRPVYPAVTPVTPTGSLLAALHGTASSPAIATHRGLAAPSRAAPGASPMRAAPTGAALRAMPSPPAAIPTSTAEGLLPMRLSL